MEVREGELKMLVEVKFANWKDVKKALESKNDTVLFDTTNLDRMFVAVWVDSYSWEDALDTVGKNLDALIGGNWINTDYYPAHKENLIRHHENKGN